MIALKGRRITKIKVLIVEDDPMVSEINREIIKSLQGFEVVGVSYNGGQAIKMAKNLCPDLLLLDIFLPDISGVDVLLDIRKDNLPIDVILVTAAHDANTIHNVFRYGAIDYIIKPYKYDRLETALNNYKSLFLKLKGLINLDQNDVDFFTVKNMVKEKIDLPKGLNQTTLKQVLLFLLKGQRPFTAEEVAEGIGLARVTARRYLEFLAETGKVKLIMKYGNVGRPLNKYQAKKIRTP